MKLDRLFQALPLVFLLALTSFHAKDQTTPTEIRLIQQPPMVKAYDIVIDTRMNRLEETILRKIKDGWVPEGGVTFDPDGHGHQLLVKYKPRVIKIDSTH